MLEVAIMIEGQDGVNWPRWQRIACAVEQAGFAGLFRSDHLIAHRGPPGDALELWASQTWLASHTSRIEFGPLVSPVSFRNPVITAMTAAAVDDLSGGRLRLGLGAGWQEREHRSFGFDLLGLKERFDRFEEALEVIERLLRSDEPISFAGRYFRLDDAILLPRPQRPSGPPIVIGGKGTRRTLPLVARYAAEWNVTSVTPEDFVPLNQQLDALLRERGREPSSVRRSLMTTVVYGRNDAEVRARLGDRTVEEARGRGQIVGTGPEIVEQLRRWSEVGLNRVQLRWQDFDDTASIEALGAEILPALAS